MKFVYVSADYPDPSDDFDGEDHAAFAESRVAWTTLGKAKKATEDDIRNQSDEEDEECKLADDWKPEWEVFVNTKDGPTAWKLENPLDGVTTVVRKIPLQ